MNVLERAAFLDAMGETTRLIRLTQAALSRARSHCHGELYEQVDSMTRRFYEARVKSEWLRQAALRGNELPLRQAEPEGRQGPDRRTGIDRRIQAMRQQLLPAVRLHAVV